MRLDPATQRLAGHTIWNVAEWLEAHYSGEPYEIFSESDDAKEFGYRLTVERIPNNVLECFVCQGMYFANEEHNCPGVEISDE